MGGVEDLEKINDEKTNLLYNTIDSLPVFTPTIAKEDRSKMNVVFVIKEETLEKEFLAICKKENIVGIKGHRTVGGFRASLYNALPLSSVQLLCKVMKAFADKKG
jgi:phosphoserine aminotransferase